MATVLITGGTGMIGKRLAEMLAAKGFELIILSRKKTNIALTQVSYAKWDISSGEIDRHAIEKADYIIHLAGAGVADKRWSDKRKKEIVKSRTASSALLVNALKTIPNKVKALISISAIGWYGPDTAQSLKHGFTEEAPADTAFLGETCRLWEESIAPVEQLGIRLVKLRTGIVLSNTGGALAEFQKPLKAAVAAVLGNGQQIISWIHIDDLCAMFLYALEKDTMTGVYNAVAPFPVTNKKLTLALAEQLRGSSFITMAIPAFILKIILGEMSIEVLKSANVNCSKVQKEQFNFQYPSIGDALKALLVS
ncbi:MAG: hypothetical protein RLZZ28_1414 [Bacteroidota bacterium]